MADTNINENTDVGQLVREMETAFISGGGTLTSKYVTSDLYDDINKIYAYLESKHWTGETDSQGREKPFFNIVLAARNIYYRATDIDRKNITVKATKVKDTIPAFVASVHIQDWMRRENFGAFLNDWGLELSAFNSTVVKFVESQGKLHKMVVPWSRLICDQVDFASNPKIELIELTEAQLYQRVQTHGYDADMVEKLCEAVAARELTDHSVQDQKTGYIKLYEVHGNLPLSYITGKDGDEDTYEQQMHVISFVASKEKGHFDDFTLVAGREEQDPYMLTSLLPNTDGSVSLNGSVKNLFQAQWMMNHTTKGIKDQLDVANKHIYQTADARFVGRNVLTAIESGDIMIHELNKPLTLVNQAAQNITAQESYMNMWKGLSSEINGVSESMLGQNPPSGQAWHLQEALLQESHSLFELMTENKALHLEEMFRRFVIPFIKKQMDSKEEISAVLEAHNITKIDSIYIPQEAVRRYNSKAVESVLNGEIPPPFDPAVAQQDVKQSMAPLGNQRFFVPDDISSKTWKDVTKDLEWELEIDITGEASDKNTILTTLNSMLVTILNPLYAGNQQAQMVVGKILQQTGVMSPLEIAAAPPPPPPQMPQTPQVGAGSAVGLPVNQ